MKSRRALAFINMLIFVIIFSMLAAVLLTLISANLRYIEHYTRRVKGYYAAEAGSVAILDSLRRNNSLPASVQVEWTFDRTAGSAPDVLKTITLTKVANGIYNSSSNYTVNW